MSADHAKCGSGDPVRRSRPHRLGSECQHLRAAVPGPGEFHRDEGRVLDLNAPTFGGCFQPERAVRLTLKDTCEEANQLFSPNRGTTVKPSAVTLNQERKVAALE